MKKTILALYAAASIAGCAKNYKPNLDLECRDVDVKHNIVYFSGCSNPYQKGANVDLQIQNAKLNALRNVAASMGCTVDPNKYAVRCGRWFKKNYYLSDLCSPSSSTHKLIQTENNYFATVKCSFNSNILKKKTRRELFRYLGSKK